MITLKYISENKSEVALLIYEKIITGHEVKNGWFEISFRSTPPLDKKTKYTLYEWSFKVRITQICNYDEVMKFLNSIKRPEIKPTQFNGPQTKLF